MGIEKMEHPCWLLSCDRCGEHPQADELGGDPHYTSEQDAREFVGSLDMLEAHGWIVCESCLDNAADEVACPVCGVMAGDPCKPETSPFGTYFPHRPHLERLEAWIKVERENNERERATPEGPDASH